MDQVLHALRVKGRATAVELAVVVGGDLAEVEDRLATLAEAGLVVQRTTGRRPGWMLSPAGRERHSEDRADSVTPELLTALGDEYAAFLRVNQRVKAACAGWQTAASDADRFDVLEDLREVQQLAAPALARSGAIAPRFGRYGQRLEAALEKAEDDPRYVVSPLVDSYHTVWFECHEDFLVTLDRSRSSEGSF